MTKPLPKIAHVDSELGFSGGEVQVLLLMEGLRARGYEQLLVAPPGSEAAKIGRARGFAMAEVPMRFDADLPAVLRMRAHLRSVDLVHLHTGRAGWLGGLAAWLAKRPAVVTRRMDRKVRRGVRTRLVYHRFAQQVAAISPAVAQCLLAGGVAADRMQIVPDALDEARIQPQRGAGAVRAELGVGASHFLVLAMAKLMHRKGLDLLLRAFAQLRAQDALLVLAGSGPEESALRDLARQLGLHDRVRFLGHREDTGDLLAACDLFVLPSRAEGLGVAALEALAARRAVLVTRVGGLAEVVRDGECGIVVPPEDVPALAAALQRLHGDEALRQRLAAAGPARVDQGFRAQHMCDSYERIYREVLLRTSV
jgi:glycosyltransferase involved in cell wall biosynthesis